MVLSDSLEDVDVNVLSVWDQWVEFYTQLFNIKIVPEDFTIPVVYFKNLTHLVVVPQSEVLPLKKILNLLIGANKQLKNLTASCKGEIQQWECINDNHENYIVEMMPFPEMDKKIVDKIVNGKVCYCDRPTIFKEVLLLSMFLYWKNNRIDFFDGVYSDRRLNISSNYLIPCCTSSTSNKTDPNQLEYPFVLISNQKEILINSSSNKTINLPEVVVLEL